MNLLKNQLNNNLLKLIGKYNMISKENVINNKIKLFVDLDDFIYDRYCLKSNNEFNIRSICKNLNKQRYLNCEYYKKDKLSILNLLNL
jgi:hypothetical protein